MKIVCTKKNLNSGLMITSRVIGSGSTLPILNNILLKTETGRLKLSSTNLEIAINTWVGGKIEEEGEAAVPARLVNDYVNNLLADKITVSTKNQILTIEAEKAKTHINALPSEEFPLIPQIGEEVYGKLSGEDLKQAIGEVGFAASYSETQPEISGVLLSFEGKTLTLAATDRYRLAEEKIALVEEVATPRQIIVPARAVHEVNRILTNEMVEVYLTEGQVCFRTVDTELVSRLIEGQYPDYQQIVPKSFTTEAELERVGFVQSLKAASLFATETNNVEVDLNPQTKQVVVKSQSAQVGDSEISIDASIVGEKNSIIFNYRYLLECLNNLPEEKIILKVISASAPAEIVPVKRDNYFYLVMPIKI